MLVPSIPCNYFCYCLSWLDIPLVETVGFKRPRSLSSVLSGIWNTTVKVLGILNPIVLWTCHLICILKFLQFMTESLKYYRPGMRDYCFVGNYL